MLDPAAGSVQAAQGRSDADPNTALSHPTAPWNRNIYATWESPEQDTAEIGSAQRFFSAMEPCSTGCVFLNFPGNEGDARVRAAYDQGNTIARSLSRTGAIQRISSGSRS
jgi:hypothetical protein